MTARREHCGDGDAVRFALTDIEQALQGGRDQLADLAERFESCIGSTIELSHSDRLLAWMAIKVFLARDTP
ncbi:MAG: hypothetical protein AB7U20_25075 [Planctomycetaceae bacterium]